MTDWAAKLKTLDPDGLDALDLAELAQPWEHDRYANSTYGQPIDIDAAARVQTPHHYVRDATGIRSMATALRKLPTPEEAIHLWIGGQHSMGHLVPAVLELAAPATIAELHISTLTFSKDNASEWASLMDAKQIGRLTVLCSKYFEKTSAGIYLHGQALLEPRGAELLPRRCHAKLACMKLSDGRTITAEGSANTRSARTLEQLTVFGHPDVYAFHVTQIGRAREAGNKDRHFTTSNETA